MFKAPNQLSLIVPPKAKGERLQNFLKQHLGERYSGKKIKQIIDHYGCRVNGNVELFSSYKLRQGDRIQLSLHQLPESVQEKVSVLYEDEDLLLWNKPAQKVCDAKMLLSVFKKPLYLVHRLDKDTTGVLLVAKNPQMQQHLEELFRKREIEKVYHALVEGHSSEESFTIHNRLGKIEEHGNQVLWGSRQDGVEAETYFKVLKRVGIHLLIQCMPVTGRTHQIRVHLKEKGLPIVGDYHYHRHPEFKYVGKRPLLHAYSLKFIHPKTQQTVYVEAPYSEDFRLALDELF